jgi:hypothetical protein
MKILIACEESQAVCKEMRRLGHECYSCDIIECSSGHPEWHIMQDVIPLLNGNCVFKTMDGIEHTIDGKWDMIIAFPPCTYLTNCATRSHSVRCTPLEKINERTLKRISAMNFFMKFVDADCDKIAIENPIGVMNTCYRKPNQVINPYMFAESVSDSQNYVTKSTCLWLKNMPELIGNNLPKPDNAKIFGVRPNGRAFTWEEKLCRAGGASLARSKTFPGIARAMAEQWAGQAEDGDNHAES